MACCRACGCRHRARALQVEAATALAFFALGAQYWDHPLLLVVSLVEAALLVAVLFIDVELRLIPTLLVAVLVVVGLGAGGVGGIFERLFAPSALKRTDNDLLERLDRYVRDTRATSA